MLRLKLVDSSGIITILLMMGALKGIYISYLGAAGKQVKMILLDGRYFRTDKMILCEVQWNGLEDEIKNLMSSFILLLMAR